LPNRILEVEQLVSFLHINLDYAWFMPAHFFFKSGNSSCSGVPIGMQWQRDFGLPWSLIFITALARGVPTGYLQPHFLALTGWPLAVPVPFGSPTPATQSMPQAGFQRRRRRTLLGCCHRHRCGHCHCSRRRRRRGWRGTTHLLPVYCHEYAHLK
jgi:hypothetical protein